MIVVKGWACALEVETGRADVRQVVTMPARWGMLHDPDGTTRSKCEVFFAPFRELRRPAPDAMVSSRTRRYLGEHYAARLVEVDLPRAGWKEEGKVTMIWYTRAGNRGKHASNERYVHPFRSWAGAVRLARSGHVRRITLGAFCVIDDRGFVFP